MVKMDLKLRYKLIEITAYWEGRLNTNHLCDAFGIGRQQASKDINDYLENFGQGNLIYDTTLKGYKPAQDFKPVFTRGDVSEYLQLLGGSDQVVDPNLDIALLADNNQEPLVESLALPCKHISPSILASILHSARRKQRLEITYVSLSSPRPEPRIIAPHTLVNTHNRWHVRAYCEKNREFRDFVLSRFRGEPELLGQALVSSEEDHYWHNPVRIKIIPDTRLDSAQRKIIAADYGMVRNALYIQTRAALVPYVLKQYNLDPQKIEARAEAQQLMIGNLAEVEKWLF